MSGSRVLDATFRAPRDPDGATYGEPPCTRRPQYPYPLLEPTPTACVVTLD